MTVSALGPIEQGVSYPIEIFRGRSGLTKSAYREAVRRGLVVRQCGKRRFVLGEDWHRFLESHATVRS